MAAPRPKSTSAAARVQTQAPKTIPWPFGKKNWIMFGVALAVIALGFVLLSQGSITAAPLLLVLGYCVLIPIAIWIKDKPAETKAAGPSPTEQ